jgi:type IV secretory pathway TrbF-like protein
MGDLDLVGSKTEAAIYQCYKLEVDHISMESWLNHQDPFQQIKKARV